MVVLPGKLVSPGGVVRRERRAEPAAPGVVGQPRAERGEVGVFDRSCSGR